MHVSEDSPKALQEYGASLPPVAGSSEELNNAHKLIVLRKDKHNSRHSSHIVYGKEVRSLNEITNSTLSPILSKHSSCLLVCYALSSRFWQTVIVVEFSNICDVGGVYHC